jgi:ADP-ribose pyrophosphatase YjhB (NUDIX family)
MPSFTYCPHCAAPLADDFVFGRVRRRCRYCGFIQFQDPKVAVAGLVNDGGRVLLVRRAAVPRIGFWALPAGYMDADELPEEAVVREIAEETGIATRAVELHSIAPLAGWNERRGILLIYRAEPLGGALAAQDDVSEARWFAPDEIPWAELAFESTAQVLREWVRASHHVPGASQVSGT